MADVKILNKIVPEELVEEAEEHYKEYVKAVPESERLPKKDYVRIYVNIFVAEEELAIKEKYLEMLKSEVNDVKAKVESSKMLLNVPNYEDESINTFSYLVFKDILNILYGNEKIVFTTEEQLQYMQQFYFNNIRNIEKEYNFLIEVNNIVKAEEESEEGVPTGLIEFLEFLNNIYYD